METEVFVTMADIRAARTRFGGYCLPGVRRWCQFHNLDYRRLIRGQVSAQELEDKGDVLATQLASVARRRAENG